MRRLVRMRLEVLEPRLVLSGDGVAAGPIFSVSGQALDWRESVQRNAQPEIYFEARTLYVTADGSGTHTTMPGVNAFGVNVDGVADLQITRSDGTFRCTGTLLPGGTHILTAAHCLTDNAGNLITTQVVATFELSSGDVTANATVFHVHPNWTGQFLEDGNDIAIVETASQVAASVPRYEIYRGAMELGTNIVKVGYGRSGSGDSGDDLPSGTKRAVLNTWDSDATVFGNLGAQNGSAQLVYDFDNGLVANDALGFWYSIPGLGLGADEGNSAPGDSGGPSFINDSGTFRIAGVTSYGLTLCGGPIIFGLCLSPDSERSDVDQVLNSSFGEFSGDTRVSSFLSFIDGIVSAPWFDNAWQYRQELVIDQTMVQGSHNDFPVLVNITDAANDLFGKAQSSGQDILFTSADGTTKFDHETEVYSDGSTKQLVAWVRVPMLEDSADTTLYMYYGNAAASDQQNPTAVWDGNTRAVWHLKEDPPLSAPQFMDSTSNDNDGVAFGSMNSGDQVAGKIGGAIDFDGSDDAMKVDDIYTGDASQNVDYITISAWVNWDGANGSDQRIVDKGYSQPATSSVYNLLVKAGTSVIHMELVVDGTVVFFNTNVPMDVGTWTHLAATFDGTTAVLYKNGVLAASQSIRGAITDSPHGVGIGNQIDRNRPLDGVLDEVRIVAAARNADYVTTQYNNQSSPGTFFKSIGNPTTVPSSSSSSLSESLEQEPPGQRRRPRPRPPFGPAFHAQRPVAAAPVESDPVTLNEPSPPALAVGATAPALEERNRQVVDRLFAVLENGDLDADEDDCSACKPLLSE